MTQPTPQNQKNKPGPKPRANTPPKIKNIPLPVNITAKYPTIKPLQFRIDLYWKWYLKGTNLHPTIIGLARFLGFWSEEQLYKFSEETPRIMMRELIKKEIARVQEYVDSAALDNQIGAIHYRKTEFNKSEKETLIIESPQELSPAQARAGKAATQAYIDERKRQLTKLRVIKKE